MSGDAGFCPLRAWAAEGVEAKGGPSEDSFSEFAGPQP
jgi:hypothetical protein